MSALAVVTKPADQSTDDLELVAAVRAGDDRAFEQLFMRYQSRITTYVRGMVRDHGRAEDITQEVFIAALRRIRQTDCEIFFRPWIYEIAKNACIDAFRRARNTSEVSFDAEDELRAADHRRLVATGSAPESVVDAKLAIDNLCGAMGGLSQTHHDILVMREFEGLSYREIGERLGMSRPAVESTLFRARRRLGAEYEELVSGERCVRVRATVDAPAERAVGLRDRRRLARHISHCQPCRRYALHAGVDVAALSAPASRIAALLPLPTFLRRRMGVDDAAHVLGAHGQPALSVVAAFDPATVSGWSRAAVAAATVAVASLGAGAAVEHRSLADLLSRAPGIVGLSHDRHSVPARSGTLQRSSSGSAARSPSGPAPRTNRGAGPTGSQVAARGEEPGAGDPDGGGGVATQAPGRSPATHEGGAPVAPASDRAGATGGLGDVLPADEAPGIGTAVGNGADPGNAAAGGAGPSTLGGLPGGTGEGTSVGVAHPDPLHGAAAPSPGAVSGDGVGSHPVGGAGSSLGSAAGGGVAGAGNEAGSTDVSGGSAGVPTAAPPSQVATAAPSPGAGDAVSTVLGHPVAGMVTGPS